MTDADLITRYNYDSFVHEQVDPWMNFAASPPVGRPAPDFPLWDLDGNETRLSAVWQAHRYTLVEFGSFT